MKGVWGLECGSRRGGAGGKQGETSSENPEYLGRRRLQNAAQFPLRGRREVRREANDGGRSTNAETNMNARAGMQTQRGAAPSHLRLACTYSTELTFF
jgi:hypothetical protein